MNLIRTISILIICLSLISCDPVGTMPYEPTEINIPGLGVVKRYQISNGGGGYESVYVVDGRMTTTTTYPLGKTRGTAAVIVIDGIEYIPKNEKN